MNRRRLLAHASVLGGLGLAGCSGGGDDADETTTDEKTTAPTTTAEQPTEAPTTEPPATTTEARTTFAGPPSPDVTITIQDNAFDPVVVSTGPGPLVEWANEDDVQHVVESTQFNDGAESWTFLAQLEPGHTTSSNFQGDGVFEYYCSTHGEATMCGVVLAGDVSQAGPLPCQSDGG